MFIPDVINTLLMGLIFMVVIVTIVRPFVLNLVGSAMSNSDMQKAAVDAVEREMMRKAELFEAQRAERIKYQMLLLEVPDKPKPKPVYEAEPEPAPEPEVIPEPVAETTEEVAQEAVVEEVVEAPVEEAPPAETEEAAQAAPPDEEEEASGEIEIREGESLADIKERMRKEQQKAKKPTIPPELLNNANSYEDKVGLVRMVVQTDQSRVASVIRGMIQTK
jgi:outer membrane biosynthesis protein TonB